MKLVIVETPEKAERLTGILGQGYEVRPSLGEVRHLALRELRMAADGEFVERYQTPRERELILAGIRRAASKAEAVYLATAPDREGELLAWDIAECLPLRERGKLRRVVLGEMTSAGVRKAMSAPRELDMKAVDAARARRLLDHLVSREMTPLLAKWHLLPEGAQAPALTEMAALHMIAEREILRREAGLKHEWRIEAQLEHEGTAFHAVMDDTTDIASSEEATRVIESLLQVESGWVVERALQHEESDEPPMPFTTATLLAEAENLLDFAPGQAAQAARTLYEAGWVTYPFTTGLYVSVRAGQAAHDAAAKLFGEEHLSQPMLDMDAVGGSASLESLRPTDPFSLPDEVSAADVGADVAALYSLIWQRFMASVMKPARSAVTMVTIRPTWMGSAEPWEEQRTYPHPTPFQARLSVPVDQGYRQIYPAPVEKLAEEQPVDLADIEPGDELTFLRIESLRESAAVLPRFSPADLAGAMAAMNIGCPSSHVAAIDRLLALGWAAVERGELVSTPRGEDALYLYVEHFEDVFDLKVIQELDRDLDRVAEGRAEWVRTTAIFFFTKIAPALEEARRAVHEPVDNDRLSEAPAADTRKENTL